MSAEPRNTRYDDEQKDELEQGMAHQMELQHSAVDREVVAQSLSWAEMLALDLMCTHN